jgi:hypothetical protein
MVKGKGEVSVNMTKVLHMHVWKQNNETHWNFFKKEKGEERELERGKFDQRTFYACI